MEIFLIISFLTGIISILSPCILPIIPILVEVSLKSKSIIQIISFISGLLSIFIIIIFLTAFFTTFLYPYIKPIRTISAIILLIIGLLMLFEYNIPFKSLTRINSNNIFSSYLLGLITSLAWTPCYSGYLISLITLLVNSDNVLYATFNIIVYCIGFTLTLFMLSIMISKINIEKLISKTKHIPKLFAILIILGAIYLIHNVI